MAAVTPVMYAEYYQVVTNNPHEGDPSAVYEDETPVPVGGIRTTPTNIFTVVCGESNPDVYKLLLKGGYRVPYARILLQVKMCSRSRGRASSFAGSPISQYEDVRLLGPTFVHLQTQDFHVNKAMVPVVAQMAPANATGG